MTRQEAIDLVAAAIRSGVYNDLGSGSNVDITIITKEGVDYLRNYQYLMGRTYTMKFPPKYPRGSAGVFWWCVCVLAVVTPAETCQYICTPQAWSRSVC